jgi:hypothetical protein
MDGIGPSTGCFRSRATATGSHRSRSVTGPRRDPSRQSELSEQDGTESRNPHSSNSDPIGGKPNLPRGDAAASVGKVSFAIPLFLKMLGGVCPSGVADEPVVLELIPLPLGRTHSDHLRKLRSTLYRPSRAWAAISLRTTPSRRVTATLGFSIRNARK